MISPLIFLIFWTMPFYVPDDNGGYTEWELQIVDKICNDEGDCIAGFTEKLPSPQIQIVGHQLFSKDTDDYGCTIFMHEMWHAWYGDWDHQEMGWCYNG